MDVGASLATFEVHPNSMTMKNLAIVLFISLMTLGVQAQEKVAKIQFTSDTVDYGEIEKGSDGVRVFEFKNTGTAPLIISKVSSSCGCTIPKKPEGPIMPGESGEIQVKYDTNRPGPIRKAITVLSNADTPTTILKIKGTVKSGSGT